MAGIYAPNIAWVTYGNQHNISTWSRLDRIYIMHDETLLREFLTMQLCRGIGSSDQFPVELECTHQTMGGWF